MSPLPPDRTPEQRAEALADADVARSARAEIKRKVRDRLVSIGVVLDQGHRAAHEDHLHASARVAGRMRVYELLRARKGIGHIRAQRYAAEAGIAADVRLDQLSREQANRLASVLSDRGLD